MRRHPIGLLVLLGLSAAAPVGQADGTLLADILGALRRAEVQRQAAVREMTYVAQARLIEWEDPSRSRVRSETVSLRRVYTRLPDQMREQYLSMSIDGRPLSPEEMRRELAAQRRGGHRDARFLNPFAPEAADRYEYVLLGRGESDGQAAWRVGFRPSAPEQDLFEGELLVDSESYRPVVLRMSPSKLPAVLEELQIKVRFAPVEGYWLPERFEMQMRVRVRFLVTIAQRVLSIEDSYRDYRLNPGLPDSLFDE